MPVQRGFCASIGAATVILGVAFASPALAQAASTRPNRRSPKMSRRFCNAPVQSCHRPGSVAPMSLLSVPRPSGRDPRVRPPGRHGLS